MNASSVKRKDFWNTLIHHRLGLSCPNKMVSTMCLYICFSKRDIRTLPFESDNINPSTYVVLRNGVRRCKLKAIDLWSRVRCISSPSMGDDSFETLLYIVWYLSSNKTINTTKVLGLIVVVMYIHWWSRRMRLLCNHMGKPFQTQIIVFWACIFYYAP
jgi:hypothetical protein